MRERREKYNGRKKTDNNPQHARDENVRQVLFFRLSARRLRKINRDNAYNNKNHICVLNSSDLHTG